MLDRDIFAEAYACVEQTVGWRVDTVDSFLATWHQDLIPRLQASTVF